MRPLFLFSSFFPPFFMFFISFSSHLPNFVLFLFCLKNVFLLFSSPFFKFLPLLAFVSGFSKSCFLRSALWICGVLTTSGGIAGIGLGHPRGREHHSTLHSAVEAPRLLKRSLSRLDACVRPHTNDPEGWARAATNSCTDWRPDTWEFSSRRQRHTQSPR